MPQQSRNVELAVTLIVIAAFALIGGLGFGVMAMGAAWKNRCSIHGDAPEGALISEWSVVGEERSWWPIGTTCEWLRADGRGTVRGTSGFPELTAATYGLLLTAGTCVTVSIVATRPRRSG